MPHKDPLPKRVLPHYHGISDFVPRLFVPVPDPVKHATPQETKEKRKRKREEKAVERLKRQLAKWDPKKEETHKTKDAYKTLFVARLNYDVSEEDLKKEFEFYGAVKNVKIMKDKKGKSRGYAFVEFESSKDLKEAYKDADGRKINGRRILVDVERGRTVKDWKPRRLGGGLGATRAIGAVQKFSGREPPATSAAPSTRRRSREKDVRDNRDNRGDRDRRDRGERVERDRGDRDKPRDPDRGDRDSKTDRGDRDSKKERRRSRSPRKDRDRSRDRDYRR